MAAGSWPRTSGTRTSPCRWRPRAPRGSIEGPLPLPGGGSMATVRDMLAKKGSDVITIAPSETVLRAAELMNERGIGGLVVAERGRPVGIFTERDILRRVVAQQRDPTNETLLYRPPVALHIGPPLWRPARKRSGSSRSCTRTRASPPRACP